MKNEKKVGTPILEPRELKLFEPVAVEFMLQELEFHIPHVQPGSYHIYERDSAGDEDLHLGSPGGPVPINTSAANTTIKCWKNSRETINFPLFLT